MTDKSDAPPSYDTLNLGTLSTGIRQYTVYDDPSPIYTAKEGDTVGEDCIPLPPQIQPSTQPSATASAVPNTRPPTTNRHPRSAKRSSPGYSGAVFIVVIIIVIISVNVFNNRDDRREPELKHLGCFKDKITEFSRNLSQEIRFGDNNPRKCFNHCQEKNRQNFVGLFNWTYCLCCKSFDSSADSKVESRECDTNCPGSLQEKCGNSDLSNVRINVYTSNGGLVCRAKIVLMLIAQILIIYLNFL